MWGREQEFIEQLKHQSPSSASMATVDGRTLKTLLCMSIVPFFRSLLLAISMKRSLLPTEARSFKLNFVSTSKSLSAEPTSELALRNTKTSHARQWCRRYKTIGEQSQTT